MKVNKVPLLKLWWSFLLHPFKHRNHIRKVRKKLTLVYRPIKLKALCWGASLDRMQSSPAKLIQNIWIFGSGIPKETTVTWEQEQPNLYVLLLYYKCFKNIVFTQALRSKCSPPKRNKNKQIHQQKTWKKYMLHPKRRWCWSYPSF